MLNLRRFDYNSVKVIGDPTQRIPRHDASGLLPGWAGNFDHVGDSGRTGDIVIFKLRDGRGNPPIVQTLPARPKLPRRPRTQ